jgi:hypothetical protein
MKITIFTLIRMIRLIGFNIQDIQIHVNIFNPYLCAFRRGHGCQTILLRLLEDWRNALEKKSVCCRSPNGSFNS